MCPWEEAFASRSCVVFFWSFAFFCLRFDWLVCPADAQFPAFILDTRGFQPLPRSCTHALTISSKNLMYNMDCFVEFAVIFLRLLPPSISSSVSLKFSSRETFVMFISLVPEAY